MVPVTLVVVESLAFEIGQHIVDLFCRVYFVNLCLEYSGFKYVLGFRPRKTVNDSQPNFS